MHAVAVDSTRGLSRISKGIISLAVVARYISIVCRSTLYTRGENQTFWCGNSYSLGAQFLGISSHGARLQHVLQRARSAVAPRHFRGLTRPGFCFALPCNSMYFKFKVLLMTPMSAEIKLQGSFVKRFTHRIKTCKVRYRSTVLPTPASARNHGRPESFDRISSCRWVGIAELKRTCVSVMSSSIFSSSHVPRAAPCPLMDHAKPVTRVHRVQTWSSFAFPRSMAWCFTQWPGGY